MLCKEAAAGAVSVRIGQNVHGGGAVVDDDGLGGLAHGYHGEALPGKSHGYALRPVRRNCKDSPPDPASDTCSSWVGDVLSGRRIHGGHRRWLVEESAPGRPADGRRSFPSNFGQIDDMRCRPLVIPSSMPSCWSLSMYNDSGFLVLLEHFPGGVLCKGYRWVETLKCTGAMVLRDSPYRLSIRCFCSSSGTA